MDGTNKWLAGLVTVAFVFFGFPLIAIVGVMSRFMELRVREREPMEKRMRFNGDCLEYEYTVHRHGRHFWSWSVRAAGDEYSGLATCEMAAISSVRNTCEALDRLREEKRDKEEGKSDIEVSQQICTSPDKSA